MLIRSRVLLVCSPMVSLPNPRGIGHSDPETASSRALAGLSLVSKHSTSVRILDPLCHIMIMSLLLKLELDDVDTQFLFAWVYRVRCQHTDDGETHCPPDLRVQGTIGATMSAQPYSKRRTT